MGLGSITRSLFGGEKSTSESGNNFADQINTSFSPWVSQGTAGMGQIANVLGLNGAGASGDAIKNWWDSSGGQFQLDQGMDAIDARFASGGGLRSGSHDKALLNYRNDLASAKLNEYLGNLFNFNQQGLGAGALISNAGQYSTSKGTKSSGGLGKAIGSIFAGISDRRLKTDIVKIGEEDDGLGRYRYRYLWEEYPREGVMADEVAILRPWALGPEFNGFRSVRYDLLEAA